MTFRIACAKPVVRYLFQQRYTFTLNKRQITRLATLKSVVQKKKKIHVSSDSYTCSTHVYRATASPSVEVVCAADAVTDAGGCCTGGYGDVVVVVVTEDV